MNLGALLLALRPLLADADANRARIVALLSDHRDLAEYEVARAWVGRQVAGGIEDDLRSVDPRVRRRAIDLVPLVLPRHDAGRLLRRHVKDADMRVRRGARKAVRALRLDDVALPDRRAAEQPGWGGELRYPPLRTPPPLYPGAWNPSGWSAGLLGQRMPPRRPRLLKGALADALPALPRLSSPDEVAAFVGVGDAGALTRFLRPGAGTGSGYVEFEVPKATGGVRRISAPRAPLKAVQRRLLDGLLALVPVHDACHGFVRGRSTVTNAKPHVGAKLVVKTDLVDFFPSVHHRRVVGLFELLGYDEEVARLLAGLTTHRPKLPDGRVVWPGALPQGAPTSPAIANLVARRLDARLSALARKVGAVYTRYADDLTFSMQKEPERGLGRFLWWVDQICQQEGFAENVRKRRVFRPSHQQRVTGIVVNDGLSVPREARRRFRAILENCRRHGVASQARGRADFEASRAEEPRRAPTRSEVDDFADYLLGFASYVHMVQPDLGTELLAQVRALLGSSTDAGGAP